MNNILPVPGSNGQWVSSFYFILFSLFCLFLALVGDLTIRPPPHPPNSQIFKNNNNNLGFWAVLKIRYLPRLAFFFPLAHARIQRSVGVSILLFLSLSFLGFLSVVVGDLTIRSRPLIALPVPRSKGQCVSFLSFSSSFRCFFPCPLWYFPCLDEDSARARILRSAGQFFYFKTFNGVLARG